MNILFNKKLGQISIPIAMVITGATTLVGSTIAGVSSYYGAIRATDEKLARANQDIAVLQEFKVNVNESLGDFRSDIKDVEKKVDALLINRGIDPVKIETQR